MQVDIQSIAAAIRAFLPSIRTLAGLTATTIDDTLVSVLEAIVSNDALLSFLQAILGKVDDEPTPAAIHSAMMATPMPAGAEASGVSIALILKWLPTIISLLAPLFSRKG